MTGRALPPTSPWSGDDGRPDPGLAAVLDGLDGLDGADRLDRPGGPDVEQVVAALRGARVLVPVLSRVEAEGLADGLRVDKEASTGVVALRAPDGRTALPVFSGTDALAQWRRDARPVPAEGPRAAAAALQEGWEVMVLDPAGAAVLVPRPAVVALAAGRPWVPAVREGRVDPEVRAAVEHALGDVGEVAQADVVAGRRTEVTVVLGVVAGLDRARLDEVVARAGERLADTPEVRDRLDSLELQVVTRRW